MNPIMKNKVQTMASTFRLYTEQGEKLSELYKLTREKNEELSKINANFSQNIFFLKEYCENL